MAELETNMNLKNTILNKSIILLENLLKKSLENPKPDIEQPALIFIKSTKKKALSYNPEKYNNMIQPLEQQLLDIKEEFSQLRTSTIN